MTTAPLVELADVAKAFANGPLALEGVNLTLRPGEFVSLLGPSGCGKSTVLRLIAGLTQPTRGKVKRAWDGDARSTNAAPPLGCVFQEPTLLPWATVWRNVYLPLRLRGIGREDARTQVDAALDMVGLADFSRAYPRELSGGMKMRASVARALVTLPQLLLLDEPFAALDEITRNRMNDDLLDLWRQHRWTGLFITHSALESVYLSTRVLVMTPRPGRIFEEISIDLPQPRTPENRTSPRYTELCRRVSRAVESAATESAEAAHA